MRVFMAESSEAVKKTTSTCNAKTFALTLPNLFRSSTLETFCTLVRGINAKSDINVVDSDVQFLFVKS